MNGVGRFNQLSAAIKTARKEQRVHTSVCTFLLDTSMANGYAVYKSIRTHNETLIPLTFFKRRVTEILAAPKLAQQATKIPMEARDVDRTVMHGSALSTYMLLSKKEGCRTRCYLCRLQGDFGLPYRL